MANIEDYLCAREQAFPGYQESTAKAQRGPESKVPLIPSARQMREHRTLIVHLQNLLLAQSGQSVFIAIVCILRLNV